MFGRLQIYRYIAELTVSQYLRYWVFPLRCSLQQILHWWAPNQCIKVENSTQMITEVDLDIQTAARGNPGTLSVWLTSLKHCTRTCSQLYQESQHSQFNCHICQKTRIHCEIFLSDYFVKHSLMHISLHIIGFHIIGFHEYHAFFPRLFYQIWERKKIFLQWIQLFLYNKWIQNWYSLQDTQ